MRRILTVACVPLLVFTFGAPTGFAAMPAQPDADAAATELASISGRVIAEAGGALVNIQAIACPTAGSCLGTFTGPDGGYTIGGLAAGSYRVSFGDPAGAYAAGYYSASGFTPNYFSATLVSVPPSAVGIDVALPTAFTISGTVRGDGDQPAASVAVNACATGGSCRSASTAADGTYSIRGLVAGAYLVNFYDPTSTYLRGYYSASGFVTTAAQASPVTVPPDAGGIDVALPLALSIAGRVTDAQGVGLVGIDVTARSPLGGSPTVQTASDGTYSVGGLMADSYRLWFSDSTRVHTGGYYSAAGLTQDWDAASVVTVPPDASGIDVALPAALHISGTVTGPDGTALAGIAVSATTGLAGGATTTAANGTYTIGGLPAGEYRIAFRDASADYASGYYGDSGFTPSASNARDVVLPPDATGINVQLPLGLRVSGMVRGTDVAELDNVAVTACPVDIEATCGTANTAADGSYVVRGLNAAVYTVYFVDRSKSHLAGFYSIAGFVSRRVDATRLSLPPDATGIDGMLPPAYSISGVVSDPGGTPLGNVQVITCRAVGAGCEYGLSGASGAYTVRGLAPGAYRLRFFDLTAVHAQGFYSAKGFTTRIEEATPITVPASRDGVDVALPLASTISGTVTGPEGSGVEWATIEACPIDGGLCATTQTQSDGQYLLRRLAPGSYQLHVIEANDLLASGYYTAMGFTPDPAGATAVDVPPDRTGIDVRMPVGFHMSGTAYGPRGDPIRRLTIEVCAAPGAWCFETISEADGSWMLRGLAAGDYTVSYHDPLGRYASGYYASGGGFTGDPADAARVRVVDADITGIETRIPGARHISGHVTGPGGVALAGIGVTACPMSGLEFCGTATTANDGSYSIGGLVRGWYEVALHDARGIYADGFYNTGGFDTAASTRIRVYIEDVSGIDMQTWRAAAPPAKYVVTASNSRPKVGDTVRIAAQLADATGDPVEVAGIVVHWSVAGGAGSFTAKTSTTDSHGTATVGFEITGSPGAVRYVVATDGAERSGRAALSRRVVHGLNLQ